MKFLKNKLFFIYSMIFYIFLVSIFWFGSYKFLNNTSYKFLMTKAVAIDVNKCEMSPYCSKALSKFPAGKLADMNIIEVIVDNETTKQYPNYTNYGMRADLLDFFHTYTKALIVDYDYNMRTKRNINNADDRKFLNQIAKMDNLVLSFTPNDQKSDDTNSMEILSDKFGLSTESKLKKNSPQEYSNTNLKGDELIKYSNHMASIDTREEIPYLVGGNNIVKIKDVYFPYSALKWHLILNNTNEIVLYDKYIYIPKTKLKIPYTMGKTGDYKTNIRYYNMLKIPSENPKKLEDSQYSHIPISAFLVYDTYYALKSGITPQTHPQYFDPQSPQRRYFNPQIFDGKIIIIGENISGPSADVMATPMHERHSGVDIKATIYNNIENNDFIYTAGILPTLIIALLLIISTFVIIIKNNFLKGLILVSILNIFFAICVWLSAFLYHYIMYLAEPLTIEIATMFFAYTYKFLSENRNKEKIKQAMGKYLSQDVMKNVVKNIDDLQLGGKRAVVTVLFSDIRGFTSLSERMTAEEVSMILNEYFSEMEPIISKYNGVINKFIGDAVMAIFGEPIQDINHPQNAVKCAYEMLKKVEYLREKWLYEGKPKIEIGIGINTGEVFIGNIGTETRMEYTVIGDTVNLASRIESYNKIYKTNLLVSSSTYEYISDIADVIKINEVKIRGKSKKMNIYEILRIIKK